MVDHHGQEIRGTILGAIMPFVGKLLGLISLESVISTIVLATLGSAAGFITTLILKKYFKTHNQNEQRGTNAKG